MADQIDERRLGRKYVPDERDWTPAQLHARLALSLPDHIADMTVRQIHDTTPYLSSWSALLAFWRWLKSFFAPKPAPPPAADTTPAWEDLVVLDQGNFGTCVGNGWAGWADAAPIEDTLNETDARAIYFEATIIDGQPDNPDLPGGGQQGSTVRSGAKAMKNRGKLTAYAFASTLADVDEWLDHHGTVVFGTDWYDSMFVPDADGWISRGGSIAGGHCYLCLDKLDDEDGYLFRNSWGEGWGLKGNFKMKTRDVAALLAAQGEACLAAEV